MKRIVAMLLALMMALSLAACGGSGGGQNAKVKFFEENSSIPTPDSFSDKIEYAGDTKGIHFYAIKGVTSEEEATELLAPYYDALCLEYGFQLQKDGDIIELHKDSDFLGNFGLQGAEGGYIFAAYILEEPISAAPKELTRDDVERIAVNALYNGVVQKCKDTWYSADPDKTRYSIATLKNEGSFWTVKGTFTLYNEYGKYYKSGEFSIIVWEDGSVTSCNLWAD